MKFSIFSLIEQIYKIVTAIIVVAVTILSFVYYNSLDDKSDTFIMATLYATFLFIVGLYLSYQSSVINNQIYERKSCYITLLRLEELYTSLGMTSIVSHDDTIRAIITFQVFTGRTSKEVSKEIKKKAVAETVPLNILMEHKPQINFVDEEKSNFSQTEEHKQNKEKHYINEIGFKFIEKLQHLEDEYTDLYTSTKSTFEKIVNNYIAENKIQLTIYGFNGLDLLDTNYENWCDEYLKEESYEKKEELITFIYKTLSNLQVPYNDLDIQKIKLINYYRQCNDQVQKNLKRMKSIYGNRLEYMINTKDDIMIELEEISQRLNEIERLINYNTVTEDINERLSYCNKSVDGLYDKILETEDNLINAMDTMQFTLEDKLGLH